MKKNTAIEQASTQRFTWTKEEKMTIEDINSFVEAYMASSELRLLQNYAQYYESLNPDLLKQYQDKYARGKTPNNFNPTAYYSTIVDTMSGYMFQNIVYSADDEAYSKTLNDILTANDNDVKDMETGTRALCYNKGIEIVYSTGDANATEIKFTSLDPRQMILVYNDNIEPKVIAGIYVIKSPVKEYDLYIDVIYKDEWQYYQAKDGNMSERQPSKQLFFSECPVIEYRTEVLSKNSSFHVVLPYINALDFIMSGNSNEIDKLADAFLAIGTVLTDEQKENMSEWKTLEGLAKEDRAEYITKDMSPQFREYVSKLLINEIHKHSHVIDWYSPDSGLSGEASGKALITRMYDMDTMSQRIEKIYRKGLMKRINLINELMGIKSMPTGQVKITFNRIKPDMMIDTAAALTNVTFISDQTKREICGIDEDVEKERLDKEKETEIDVSDLMPQKPIGDKMTPTEEDETV